MNVKNVSGLVVFSCVTAISSGLDQPRVVDVRPEPLYGGWGVDALLSCAIPEESIDGYLGLLRNKSGIALIRERGTTSRGTEQERGKIISAYSRIRGAGVGVLSFAQDIKIGELPWNVFAADCRDVYEEGRRLGRDYAELVSVWELHNEPELAWWPEMPDRYASHAKALYLGLKAGSREAGREAVVLSGALGLPAGPWVERTGRNGVFEYADAWNVHYYGDETQFSGLLDGHVQAMKDLLKSGKLADRPADRKWPIKGWRSPYAVPDSSVLPIWATEVGINTVTPSTWSDPVRRRKQADWVLSTAKQALVHPSVAVFMPFVLVHKNDGYAMTESAEQAWPAWDDYALFTRGHPFPSRPTVKAPSFVNPIVLQWLADPETASGHKLASAYRWRGDGKPIQGQLRIYNFGRTEVSGHIQQSREPGDGISGSNVNIKKSQIAAVPGFGRLTVPAGAMISFPLSFSLEDAFEQGGREWRQFTFIDTLGRRSELGFALERSPDLYPPDWVALKFGLQEQTGRSWRYLPNSKASDFRGPWSAVNGVKVLYAKGSLARFEIGSEPADPEYPPYVAAALPEGLPSTGWLRVAARPSGPVFTRFRVDLIDQAGRRFTQWEHLGHVNGLPITAARWLNLADFHPYAWGKLDTTRRLSPKDVRELQLRFYATRGPAMIDVELGFGVRYGAALDPAGEVVISSRVKDTKSAPIE